MMKRRGDCILVVPYLVLFTYSTTLDPFVLGAAPSSSSSPSKPPPRNARSTDRFLFEEDLTVNARGRGRSWKDSNDDHDDPNGDPSNSGIFFQCASKCMGLWKKYVRTILPTYIFRMFDEEQDWGEGFREKHKEEAKEIELIGQKAMDRFPHMQPEEFLLECAECCEVAADRELWDLLYQIFQVSIHHIENHISQEDCAAMKSIEEEKFCKNGQDVFLESIPMAILSPTSLRITSRVLPTVQHAMTTGDLAPFLNIEWIQFIRECFDWHKLSDRVRSGLNNQLSSSNSGNRKSVEALGLLVFEMDADELQTLLSDPVRWKYEMKDRFRLETAFTVLGRLWSELPSSVKAEFAQNMAENMASQGLVDLDDVNVERIDQWFADPQTCKKQLQGTMKKIKEEMTSGYQTWFHEMRRKKQQESKQQPD